MKTEYLRSKSRNVNAYVANMLKHDRFNAQLKVKLERLNPFQRKTDEARWKAIKAYNALNDAQMEEAKRLLDQARAGAEAARPKPIQMDVTELLR
jgi:hypothetical protein